MSFTKELFFVSLIMALMALVGTMDYQDAVEERKLYDRMVCGHHWPDYKRLNPICEVAVVTPSDG